MRPIIKTIRMISFNCSVPYQGQIGASRKEEPLLRLNKFLKRIIPFILFAVLCSCSPVHEFRLKSDGSIYSNGSTITDNELIVISRSFEIILNVETDVPYEKVIEILTRLEKAGVKKIGLKTGIDKQN